MSHKTNLLVDFGVFAAFLVALEPGLTGIAVHEWFSLAFAGTLITHILLHWKWIVSVGGGFFKKLFHVSRLKLVVDVLIFAAFTAAVMSGLLISRSMLPTFGLQAANSFVWRTVHASSASLTVVLAGVHVALSWSWVVTMMKRYLVSPVATAVRGLKPQPRPEPVAVEVRKD